MKLKTRMLSGILALLSGMCMFVPSASAMDSQRIQRRDSLPVFMAGRSSGLRRKMAFNAIRQNDAEMIRSLFDSNRSDINIENGVGDTLLLAAAKDASLPCMIALLKYPETDMDALTTDGKTMWHILLENRRWGAVKILLGDIANREVTPEIIKRCKDNFCNFFKKIDTRDLKDDYICSLQINLPRDIVERYAFKLRQWNR